MNTPGMNRKPVGVGVIGLGFMGATHVRAYQSAQNAGIGCRVVAVSDSRPERLLGMVAGAGNLDSGSGSAGDRLFDPAQVRTSAAPSGVIDDPEVDLVSICTPTDTHVELALSALRAGKHVLVEKPVAIRSVDVERVAEAAARSGRLCMPGMCMRFWPGWDWLREAVRDGRYGRVLSATFQRLGTVPTWSADFYGDVSRSGGTLFDLHIHDADFVRWCFGPPSATRGVRSTGSVSHITTQYLYDAGMGPSHVVAEGGQDHQPGFGFRMRYIVAFERATADWDLSRTPTLLLCRDGRAEQIDLPRETAYERQARHMIEAVRDGWTADRLRATMAEAVEVTRMLEMERDGLRG